MAALGLLPPYTAEDVRMAYREKAKAAHPDRGGSPEQFQKLHEAYERALEYVKFRSGRRHWLATQVERYAEQETVVAEVRRRGGQIQVEELEWLKRSIGPDFSLVTERLRGIRLRDQPDGDAFLALLAAHPSAVEFLVWIDLAGCRITDEGLQRLRVTPALRQLDVSRTPVTRRGLDVLSNLPLLEWIHLGGTKVNWLARWRLQWSYPKLKVVA
jgi:hypothetical protein